jgi:hypothetical protein
MVMGNLPRWVGNTTKSYIQEEVLHFLLGFHHQDVLHAEENAKRVVFQAATAKERKSWGVGGSREYDYIVLVSNGSAYYVLLINNAASREQPGFFLYGRRPEDLFTYFQDIKNTFTPLLSGDMN